MTGRQGQPPELVWVSWLLRYGGRSQPAGPVELLRSFAFAGRERDRDVAKLGHSALQALVQSAATPTQRIRSRAIQRIV